MTEADILDLKLAITQLRSALERIEDKGCDGCFCAQMAEEVLEEVLPKIAKIEKVERDKFAEQKRFKEKLKMEQDMKGSKDEIF